MFKNPFQVAVTFAVVALVIKLVIFSLEMQHSMENTIVYIYMFVLLTAVFFGMRSNRYVIEGNASFGDNFKSGARTASFFAILVAVITYFYYSQIDIEFFSNKQAPHLAGFLDVAKEKLASGEVKKKVIISDLSNQIQGLDAYLSPYFQAMWTMFGLVFMGLLNSFVFALLLKKIPSLK